MGDTRLTDEEIARGLALADAYEGANGAEPAWSAWWRWAFDRGATALRDLQRLRLLERAVLHEAVHEQVDVAASLAESLRLSREQTAIVERKVSERQELLDAACTRLAHIEGLVRAVSEAQTELVRVQGDEALHDLALDDYHDAVDALAEYAPTAPPPPDPRDATIADLRDALSDILASGVVPGCLPACTCRHCEPWRRARALVADTPATPRQAPGSAPGEAGCPDGAGGDGDATSEPVAPSASAAPGADVLGDLPVRVRGPDRPGEREAPDDHHDHGPHDRGHAGEQGEQVQAQGDHGEGHEHGQHPGRVGREGVDGKP